MKKLFTILAVAMCSTLAMAQNTLPIQHTVYNDCSKMGHKYDYTQLTDVPIGAISGKFSVSDTKQVYFSKGNLQYQASTNTWRFAENQWDYIGADNINVSSTYAGWIDLFGWGTGDNPTKWDTINASYAQFTDWGNYVGNWHTLSKDEWEYLLNDRPNANNLYSYIILDSIKGVLLFPDDYKDSVDVRTTWSESISYSDFLLLEKEGVIFFTTAGVRSTEYNEILGYNNNYYNMNIWGDYWSSTPVSKDVEKAYYFMFDNQNKMYLNALRKSDGRAVRLVQEVK